MAELKQVAVYGKGGIGKSTTTSNIAAAASHMGLTVLQVGCDPKSDSTTTLLGGKMLPTILNEMRTVGISDETWDKCVVKGYNGVWCSEAGGPRPGAGCAGKGVAVALDLIAQYKIREKLGITFALYDVLGDVVCGGFAQPMRRGYAREIYLITSGELMALYAANNIAKAVSLLVSEGADCAIGGIINNMRNVAGEKELVEDFASILGVPIMAYVPRSELVQKSELERKTVVEAYPESPQAKVYAQLAERIIHNKDRKVAKTMEIDDIIKLLNKHQMLFA
ncbi:MAG: AAA family ATPase [Chloroflexi bacterium]|nr:AAA family ATPase [Chloroflexota bacterium]